MKNIAKTVFNTVFSFGGGIAMMVLGFGLLAFSALLSIKAESAACIRAGLIKVSTDAGSYCVAPSNLVEIK